MQRNNLADLITRDRTDERVKRGACMRCEVNRATVKREYERSGKWNACQTCADAMDVWHSERALKEQADIILCVQRGAHRPLATDEHLSGWVCGDCQLPEKTAYRLAPDVEWPDLLDNLEQPGNYGVPLAERGPEPSWAGRLAVGKQLRSEAGTETA